MKVITIFPHLPLPEEERTTYERAIRERFLTNRLTKAGHAAEIWFLTHNSQEFSLTDGSFRPRFFPIDNACRRRSRKFFVSSALLQALRTAAPDVVVFKGLGYLLPYWLLKQKALPGHIAFIVGGNTWDILLPQAGYIFAEFTSQLKQEFAKSAVEERVVVLHKYVRDEDFIDPSEKTIDIISVGDISHRKNHKALLPLAAKWRTEIIGDGPLRSDLEAEAEARKVQMEFTGSLHKEQISAKIAAARVMVHPSKSEGFPRAFAEAFACGVPVIALKHAIKGEFPDGSAGVLTDENTLEHAVDSLLLDPAAREEYSRNARRIAERSYRGEAVYATFLKGIERMQDSLAAAKPPVGMRVRAALRVLYWLADFAFFTYGAKAKRRIMKMIRGNNR